MTERSRISHPLDSLPVGNKPYILHLSHIIQEFLVTKSIDAALKTKVVVVLGEKGETGMVVTKTPEGIVNGCT